MKAWLGAALLALAGCASSSLPYKPEVQPEGARNAADEAASPPRSIVTTDVCWWPSPPSPRSPCTP